MATGKTAPPKPDELELSLFGPGVGECVVLHLGGGNWVIVDSCLNEARDTPVAIEYLHGLDVDPSQQVKLVVATHWHDDHIRGIAQVLEEATAASFACSGALRSEEFLTLVLADEDIRLVEHTSGVSEFADVLRILRDRRPRRSAVGPDHWASSDMVLYTQQSPFRIEVDALSPSAQTITDSKRHIARMIPAAGDAIGRLPSVEPNDLSVVLLVKSTDFHVLLGADLENGRDELRGWQAVLSADVRPPVRSNAYKIAHHGSENADNPGIWSLLLGQKPHAILTPYVRGRKPLPSPADIRRIKSKSCYLYSTVWPPTKRPPRRRIADRTLKAIVRHRAAAHNRPGHIRLRARLGGVAGASAEVFDGARQL